MIIVGSIMLLALAWTAGAVVGFVEALVEYINTPK
jgi:hypothetical protein